MDDQAKRVDQAQKVVAAIVKKINDKKSSDRKGEIRYTSKRKLDKETWDLIKAALQKEIEDMSMSGVKSASVEGEEVIIQFEEGQSTDTGEKKEGVAGEGEGTEYVVGETKSEAQTKGGGKRARLKHRNELSLADREIIKQIEGMILAEQNRKCALSRTVTINLNAYFSGAYLTEAEKELDGTIKKARNSQRLSGITLDKGEGVITIKNQPTAVLESDKGNVDKAVAMIVAMVQSDLEIGAEKERTLTTNIDWKNLGIEEKKEKDAVVSELQGVQFNVNGRKEKLLMNAKRDERVLQVTYVVPEIKKTKAKKQESPSKQTERGSSEQPVTGVKKATSAQVEKCMRAAEKSLGPVGIALAMGAGLMAISVFGGSPFLLVSGVVLAFEWMKQQQKNAQNNNAVPQN